jgi:uncharacterized delta-60 repeat protein
VLAGVLLLAAARPPLHAAAACIECCASSCGDGMLDPGEGCDDGNVVDGDGCSSACRCEIAAPGTLACGFGVGGIVGRLLMRSDTCQSFGRVAMQPDGRLVVVGGRFAGLCDVEAPGARFLLARLNADGTPDATFGTDGVVLDDVAAARAQGICAGGVFGDIAVDSMGGIVVSAFVQVFDGTLCNFVIGFNPPAAFRFRMDGSFDEAFGGGGVEAGAEGPIGFDPDGHVVFGNGATALAVDDGGRIVTSNGVVTMRRSPTGDLDLSFGDAGFASLGAQAIAIQSNGRIVLTTSSRMGFATYDAGVVRLLESGAPDPDFGIGGLVTPSVVGQPAVLVWTGLALQPDGKIIVAGLSEDTPTRAVVARLTDAGALDVNFGNGGIAWATVGPPNYSSPFSSINVPFSGIDVFLQPNGRIVAAAATQYSDNSPVIVAFEGGWCGDGTVQPGEGCDDGAVANGSAGSCCTTDCLPRQEEAACAGGTCQAGICVATTSTSTTSISTTSTSTTSTSTTSTSTTSTSTTSTSTTSTSTTSTSTTSTSSTTTLPCTTVRCLLDPSTLTECAHDTIPQAISRKLANAGRLLERADGSPPRRARALRRRARTLLAAVRRAAKAAARGPTPSVSATCAAAIGARVQTIASRT